MNSSIDLGLLPAVSSWPSFVLDGKSRRPPQLLVPFFNLTGPRLRGYADQLGYLYLLLCTQNALFLVTRRVVSLEHRTLVVDDNREKRPTLFGNWVFGACRFTPNIMPTFSIGR